MSAINTTASPPAPPLLVEFGRRRPGLSSILIHPAGGGLGAYAGVALRLSRLGSAAGIRAHGLAEGEAPDASVAALRERYGALLADLPRPPDLLFGWSLGGVLAWELAAGYAAAGHRPLVVMVDAPGARIDAEPAAADSWRRRVHAARSGTDDGLDPRRVAAVTDAHLDAVTAYQAERRSDCPTLLMTCAKESNDEHVAAWRRVAADLTVRTLPADHFGAFDGESLPVLLGHLGEFLDRAARERS